MAVKVAKTLFSVIILPKYFGAESLSVAICLTIFVLIPKSIVIDNILVRDVAKPKYYNHKLQDIELTLLFI